LSFSVVDLARASEWRGDADAEAERVVVGELGAAKGPWMSESPNQRYSAAPPILMPEPVV
jgi:hypothetical protein